MRIKEITFRHRNDFHFVAECEHCQHAVRYGDGYADHYYCTQVVPNRHCPKCDLNSYGQRAEALAHSRPNQPTPEAK